MDQNEEKPPSKPDSEAVSGCLGFFAGSCVGVVGGFLLPWLYYQFTNPQILQDGQWGFVYFTALPFGIFIGGIIGYLWGTSR